MIFNTHYIILGIFILSCRINANLTGSEKIKILELHQKAREAVHAPDMKELQWDDDITEEVEKYTNLCKSMDTSEGINDNLASASYDNVTMLFDLWMSEKDVFDQSGYRKNLESLSFNGKAINHYSQIVWAENKKLGCGYKYCDNTDMYLLICRYQTGNILGKQVYGEPVEILDDNNFEKESGSSRISRLAYNNLFYTAIIMSIFYILL